jgi:hypothetical protein
MILNLLYLNVEITGDLFTISYVPTRDGGEKPRSRKCSSKVSYLDEGQGNISKSTPYLTHATSHCPIKAADLKKEEDKHKRITWTQANRHRCPEHRAQIK